MKNSKVFLWTLVGLITLNSCGEGKTEKDQKDTMHHEVVEETVATATNLDNGTQGEVKFKEQDLAAVYEHYLGIKTALVNTDSEDARGAAKELVEALKALEDKKSVLDPAQLIAQNEDVNEQRTAFLNLSAGMEDLLSGAVASGEIYKQYCPMAFQGKGGFWFSSSEEVRNPYYGDKMLKCGSVRDTIK